MTNLRDCAPDPPAPQSAPVVGGKPLSIDQAIAIAEQALPGAFASDDWWARTATRGHMPWVTLGWSQWLRLRVFGTFEWRDGVPERSERLVGELSLRWNTR